MDDTFWNYRILKRKDSHGKTYYGLVEVYYTNNNPRSWTKDDLLYCDEEEGPEGIVRTLMLMLKDAQKHAVLDEQELKDSLEKVVSIFSDKDAVEKAFGVQTDEA